MKLSTITKKLAEYIAFPLAFFIFGILFFYLVFNPFLNLMLDGWALFSSDSNITSGEEIHNDIFGVDRLEGYTDFVPSSLITYPKVKTRYAEISILADNCEYTIPLYFGDNKSILRRGAGHYVGSHFPGESSTVLVSGHNNTYFNCLQYIKVGDIITLTTNYGVYKYEVTETAVKKNSDKSAYDLSADFENLILYTCYPFDRIGLTPDRYFVYTKLLSGPKILKGE